MRDLPALLVGVFPLVLAVGLLVLIARRLPPLDGAPPRPTRADTATPRVRPRVPTAPHPRRRRPFPML